MKKTLVALAVLAASGASMAQSTVTLYGIADVWFGSETTDNGTTSLSQTKLNSGAVNGSRFGLRGSEDLGAGMKANFQFEQGFNIDDGVGSNVTNNAGIPANTVAFSRHAWVGLSGSFGSTRFGRSPTAYDDVSGAAHGALDSSLAPTGNGVFRSTAYTVRANNSIGYYTPNFSGFSAAVSYGLGEDKTATTDAGSLTAFNLAYAAGPLTAQLGYQTEKLAAASGATISATTGQPTVTSTVPTTSKDFTRVGATYDLGAALLKANYGKAAGIGNVSGAEATEYQIAVDVPFGATTLSAAYATSQDNATAGDAKRTGYGLTAKYALSKRTFAYGGYESDTTSKPAALDAKHTLLAIGLQHRF